MSDFSRICLVVFCILMLIIVLALRVRVRATDQENYQSACQSKGGQAAWNGRNWECIK